MERGFDAQALVRGLHELLVLATLRSGALHGYQIAIEIEARTSGLVVLQHGTLYPILHRLEKQGLMRGRWMAGRGVKGRKDYTLTAAGARHLAAEASWAREALERVLVAIEPPEPQAVRGTS